MDLTVLDALEPDAPLNDLDPLTRAASRAR